MPWLGTLFLYLHIGGAIVAFGPTIAFPIIGARAAKEPMHGNFALRVTEFLTERVVEPGAIFVFLMGVGLIITRGYNLVEDLWVTVAIVLFIITLSFSYFVQLRTVREMIAMTNQPPPPDAPPGPPPGFPQLSTRAARGGAFMTLLLFTILALMVVKPF
ncbi:MAG TPA: DUF2269 family protein [Candidatus Udaeobacter sp.]|jgi:Predicted integral membrane protein (DUF2269)|nr:DUF2269 family protein [Candidatus Udaeobacter sp.]